MKILALEFSSARRSVALVVGGHGQGAAMALAADQRTPLELVNSALDQAHMPLDEIDCLAVGLGPGSYTGIRAGIALAQGWQLARRTRLIGISSVECLAAQALEAGLRGRLSIAIDAQRAEFYLATYELEPAGARLVEPLRLVGLEAARARVGQGAGLVGPELDSRIGGARGLCPDASTLGRLAEARTDFVSGECLEPIYPREIAFTKAPPPRVIPPAASEASSGVSGPETAANR